jgi:DNA polymerase-3 subunit delta'
MWQVYGQDHILGQLEASLKQGRQAHAYLLVGPPHVGKMTLALNLAQSVNCLQGPGAPCSQCVQCTRIMLGLHADVRVLALELGESEDHSRTVIGISDVKEILRQVHLKPFEGASSVIIIDSAELMSEEASNALLKTLEEPPPQVMILLLTTDDESILPTIRSRCRRLALLPLAKDKMVDKLVAEHQAAPQEAEMLSRLSRGCLGWAINALDNGGGAREQREEELERLIETCRSGLETRFNYANELASSFYRDRDAVKQSLYFWLRWWRDLLLIKEGGEEYIHNSDRQTELRFQATQLTTAEIVRFINIVLATLEALGRNASARLALEVLMLGLPPTAAVA